jgi:fructose/tagatose bisphosphate aldolase
MQKAQLVEAIRMVPANDHTQLFGHLILVLIQISHVDHPEHFKQVQDEVNKIFSSSFINNSKSSKKMPLLQLVARSYTEFLLHA